jgi:hypothetical protein
MGVLTRRCGEGSPHAEAWRGESSRGGAERGILTRRRGDGKSLRRGVERGVLTRRRGERYPHAETRRRGDGNPHAEARRRESSRGGAERGCPHAEARRGESSLGDAVRGILTRRRGEGKPHAEARRGESSRGDAERGCPHAEARRGKSSVRDVELDSARGLAKRNESPSWDRLPKEAWLDPCPHSDRFLPPPAGILTMRATLSKPVGPRQGDPHPVH